MVSCGAAYGTKFSVISWGPLITMWPVNGYTAGAIVVGSVAVALEEKPPAETDTWLVTLAGALAATFTVRVIGG